MRILLTNDDGIYAPGLAAMRAALARLGEVHVVAPATEQSGVGHGITFLTPLMASQVFDGDEPRGWAVEGSPADCVKLALAKLCVDANGEIFRPDLVVSGINWGLNAGINVLYSGTVAAATEAALNDLPAIAVSLEWEDHSRFNAAAAMATDVIAQMLERNAWREHRLYNLNIPTVATLPESTPELRITRMGSTRWDAAFEERLDPKGRRYFWTIGTPPTDEPGADTDIIAIRDGAVSLSPLIVDRTRDAMLGEMADWNLQFPAGSFNTTNH
ncbi:5'/3'-nucleotidase SurE [Botrimarina mediterranea]|uniref:5'-nucleotidase SurE n=1 Tax=Botrimarina mediterranea TaxID=2528022 RepID=A0A518KB60_9BACT|nr:5'/3'-nucleotidase SurE [Botrimarina mediterranea]QDV75023.1 5'-nucleotidase SurE [Botrimarina mediterranea]QDV79670.1 5'-nucleotidase SurE [Planctomycetes bacterium K2D]